jgi:hypothetical protein
MTALGLPAGHLILTLLACCPTAHQTGLDLAILAALGLLKLGLPGAGGSIAPMGSNDWWQLFEARLISQAFGSQQWDHWWQILGPAAKDTSTYNSTRALVRQPYSGSILPMFLAELGILVASNGPQLLAVTLATVAILAVGFVFLLRKAPIVPRLRELLARKWKNHPARLTTWLIQAEEIEEPTVSFHRRHPKALHRILLLNLAVQVVMGAEVLIVLAAIGVKIGFLQLLATEGATHRENPHFISRRVGADEASGAGAFVLFGMDGAAGLTLAIARRIQALVWVAAGLAWWQVMSSRKPGKEGSCAISTVAVSN